MNIQTEKIAISIPKSEFKVLEHIRHELGIGRSAALLEALQLWIQSQEIRKLESRYEAGYKKKPESGVDNILYKISLSSFGKGGW